MTLFKRNQNHSQNEGLKTSSIGIGRISSFTILSAIILGILIYTGFQVKEFYDNVAKNWEEIKFSTSHPAIVKSVREQYESKQKAIEEDFLKKEKSSEEKLIDEVTTQLKQSK